jgi:tetratricopeptide (TPR) repeat protein
MGFWDKQDKRYTQARSALIFSVTAVSLSAALVATIVFFATRKQSQPRAGDFEMTEGQVIVPMPTPSPGDLRRARLSAWHERLSECTKNLDWSETEVLALQILEEEPSDAMAWIALARAQQHTGRVKDARSSLSKALGDQEAAPYALYLRATLLRTNGDHEAAIADLEQASDLDPGSIVIWNTLLLAKIHAGRDAEVRNTILGYVQAGIPSQESRWLLPAAAIALKDKKPDLAAKFFESFDRVVSAALSAELLADPAFDPYKNDARWKLLFERAHRTNANLSNQPGTSPAAGE